MAKRLKNRSMSMYRGPLSKMIDDAVNDRMAALKKTEGEEKDMIYDMSGVEGKTRHVEFDPDNTKLSDDWYAQNTSYGSEEEFRRNLGQEQVDIVENRQASNRFYNDANKVDFENMSDAQQKTLSSMYGKQVDNLDVYQKDGKFYVDQGTHIADEKGFTNPIEITDPAFQTPDQASARTEGQEQAPANAVSVRDIFGIDSEMRPAYESSDRLSNMQFSDANPTFDFLNDEKMMKKARKAYNKFQNKGGISKRDKAMPFFEFVMKRWDGHGQTGGKSLTNIAKRWETKNKPGEGRSGLGLEGGAATSASTYRPSKPREASEASDPAPTNKLKYANPNHVLNKRTMSFRRKR